MTGFVITTCRMGTPSQIVGEVLGEGYQGRMGKSSSIEK